MSALKSDAFISGRKTESNVMTIVSKPLVVASTSASDTKVRYMFDSTLAQDKTRSSIVRFPPRAAGLITVSSSIAFSLN